MELQPLDHCSVRSRRVPRQATVRRARHMHAGHRTQADVREVARATARIPDSRPVRDSRGRQPGGPCAALRYAREYPRKVAFRDSTSTPSREKEGIKKPSFRMETRVTMREMQSHRTLRYHAEVCVRSLRVGLLARGFRGSFA